MTGLNQVEDMIVRTRIFVAKQSPIVLDGVAGILYEVLKNLEHGTNTQFSFCGGLVRNSLVGKGYNDFDIASSEAWYYRNEMQKMGLMILAEDDFDDNGVRQHDYFINPFDFNGAKYPVHWIDTVDHNGYAPAHFDYSINEFSLKSDALLHAPTYAWRHFEKKVLKANDAVQVTTNMIMRGLRFAAITNFSIDQETVDRFKKRFAEDDLDLFRVQTGIQKILEDGVANECFAMMQALGYPNIRNYDNIIELLNAVSTQVKLGTYKAEKHTDYQWFEDLHPNRVTDTWGTDTHNDMPF